MIFDDIIIFDSSQQVMERHTWQKVLIHHNSREPSPRWGHCSVVRKDEIIHFGGYADSNYMSDIWSFSTTDMTWSECKTTGEVPSARSNCTLHYQPKSDRIVLFGGGGPNKKRFNGVSVLDWQSKVWREIEPREQQRGPWERTYHSSQLLYPYLVVFGGEGLADLDDLWAFNLQTEQWCEMKAKQGGAKPCARRFHTSVVIGSIFFVIGGCHGKYRCLNDIWSIDLREWLQGATGDRLEWKEIKMKGSSFLTRWGHSSTVFDGKIYIFGGRFSSDLQDILVIDPGRESIKSLKVSGELPKARRRHSAVFVGSCMLVFGGFNGEYFNDMHYINAFDLRPKIDYVQNTRDADLVRWVGSPFLADERIACLDGKSVPVHRGLLTNRFAEEAELSRFMEYVQNRYNFEEVMEILQTLYLGAGRLKAELDQMFRFQLFETTFQRNNNERRLIDADLVQFGSLSTKTRSSQQVIVLTGQKYLAYLQRQQQTRSYDLLVVIGKEECIPVNKTLLAVASPYFFNLLRHHCQEVLQIENNEFGDARVYQVMLNFLQTGYLVVPEGLDEKCWLLLYQLAEYLCLTSLRVICQGQLINLLNDQNCQFLLNYSMQNGLDLLALHSGELKFRRLLQKGDHRFLMELKEREQQLDQSTILSQILQTVRFDLEQLEKRRQHQLQQPFKPQPGNSIEKENNGECFFQ